MDRGTAQQTDVNDAQVSAPRSDAPQSGLQFSRVFSRESVDPFDEIAWEQRSATIGNEHGELVFEQRDVEIPTFWSQQATNIVVSKYFR